MRAASLFATLRRYFSATDAVGHPGTISDKIGHGLSNVQHTVSDTASNIAHQVREAYVLMPCQSLIFPAILGK
jgi:hypothetical protein